MLRGLISSASIQYLAASEYIKIRKAFADAGIDISQEGFKVVPDRDSFSSVVLVDLDLTATADLQLISNLKKLNTNNIPSIILKPDEIQPTSKEQSRRGKRKKGK